MKIPYVKRFNRKKFNRIDRMSAFEKGGICVDLISAAKGSLIYIAAVRDISKITFSGQTNILFYW